MNCKDAKELFSEYFDQILDEEKSSSLEMHFKECKICREDYDKYCLIFSSVKCISRDRGIDQNFTKSIMSEIKKEQKNTLIDLTAKNESKKSSFGKSYLSSYFVGGAIAASVLVVAGLTIGNRLNQNIDSKLIANPNSKIIQKEFKVDDKYVARDNQSLDAVKDSIKNNTPQIDKAYGEDVVPVKEKY